MTRIIYKNLCPKAVSICVPFSSLWGTQVFNAEARRAQRDAKGPDVGQGSVFTSGNWQVKASPPVSFFEWVCVKIFWRNPFALPFT